LPLSASLPALADIVSLLSPPKIPFALLSSSINPSIALSTAGFGEGAIGGAFGMSTGLMIGSMGEVLTGTTGKGGAGGIYGSSTTLCTSMIGCGGGGGGGGAVMLDTVNGGGGGGGGGGGATKTGGGITAGLPITGRSTMGACFGGTTTIG
jgi:hypothetical protein